MKNRRVELGRHGRPYSTVEAVLALSLAPYVADADAGLPRDQFLRLVLDRIVNDLSAPIGGTSS